MGQKTHPIGMRLGYIQDWRSTWYADSKDYARKLNQDIKIREFLTKKLSHASISQILIERPSDNIKIIIHTARPGIVIGKKGEDVDKLKIKISQIMGISPSHAHINVEEIKKPELEAKIVSDIVAQQIEKRVAFRRAMKRAIQNTMRSGALGVKINISGRLGGAEIARVEWNREGRIPLHTLRANIDYAISQAFTTYGTIGIKVWIFKNEIKQKTHSKFKKVPR